MRNLLTILSAIVMFVLGVITGRKIIKMIIASGGTITGMFFLALGEVLNAGRTMVAMATKPDLIVLAIRYKLLAFKVAREANAINVRSSLYAQHRENSSSYLR